MGFNRGANDATLCRAISFVYGVQALISSQLGKHAIEVIGAPWLLIVLHGLIVRHSIILVSAGVILHQYPVLPSHIRGDSIAEAALLYPAPALSLWVQAVGKRGGI